MGLQKYRADLAGPKSPNGSTPWYVQWMGGPSLALVRECPTPWGPRTVYVRAEPDTYFSQPAACEVREGGKRYTVKGFLTWGSDTQGFEFRPNVSELATELRLSERYLAWKDKDSKPKG